ncbi:hypothetical protein GCM10025862_16580 [Arsenicicoccus piscis]|uniref:Uncharacterized protein n=1 Tax=Arsenicicoccus piscis TaxID=673954 RepID=A0ABQ6HNT5_9MICO|nr:hypothetical protein GCM10025862_16580 [Arsenicicoccus piscis]
MGVVELRAQVVLELAQVVPVQRTRVDVELDVEPAQLGLERLGGHRQRALVGHAGAQLAVDEVELDLEAHHRVGVLEVTRRQHPREDVQALLDLLAVLLTLASGHDGADLFTHARHGTTPTPAQGARNSHQDAIPTRWTALGVGEGVCQTRHLAWRA